MKVRAFVLLVLLASLAPLRVYAYGFWDQYLNVGTVKTPFTSTLKGTIYDPITYSYCLYPVPPYDGNFAHNWPLCNLTSPTTWGSTSLAWVQNGSWSDPNYWVLALNNETSQSSPGYGSYVTCNQGPPDLSLPVSAPGQGVFGFSVLQDQPAGEYFYRAHLVLNLAEANPCMYPPDSYAYPYMQFGAQDTRGNGGLLGYFNPDNGAPYHVHFTAKLYDHKRPDADCGPGPGYYCLTVFRMILLAQWQDDIGRDVPRMIQLNLYRDYTPGDGFTPAGWNWRLAEDFYFPGADIAYMDGDLVQSRCPSLFPQGIPAQFSYVGQQIDYYIDAQALYRCASDNNLFREPMPTTPDVMFRGVHWALEGAGSDGWLWVAISNMYVY